MRPVEERWLAQRDAEAARAAWAARQVHWLRYTVLLRRLAELIGSVQSTSAEVMAVALECRKQRALHFGWCEADCDVVFGSVMDAAEQIRVDMEVGSCE